MFQIESYFHIHSNLNISDKAIFHIDSKFEISGWDVFYKTINSVFWSMCLIYIVTNFFATTLWCVWFKELEIGAMFIVVRNGIGDESSNPEWGCLCFILW